MTILNLKNDTELCSLQCGTCGVWHAIPKTMYNTCFEEGGFWTCPNGHSRGFNDSSLRKQLEKETKRRKWAEQNAENARNDAAETERRRIAQKAATTRLKNRAKAGVCPCCTRTFKQLSAHMKNKHPEYAKDK